MKGGRGNNENFSARLRAVNYKASRNPHTTNPRIAHVHGVNGSANPPAVVGCQVALQRHVVKRFDCTCLW